ncbi:MAG: hypothetical protein ABSE16_09070 [Verrucomicrobiota bacterium]|jgi:hypothetical protein
MMRWLVIAFLACALRLPAAPVAESESGLWTLARQSGSFHRFSVLFTESCVTNYLSSDAGIADAIEWCQASGITKVYLEEFRSGKLADRETLARARDRFRAAGFLVSGCVTTTGLGKPTTGPWTDCCYTDPSTQDQLQAVFEYAASLFNEIMIDDFFFTDCTCPECDTARRQQVVTIGSKRYPVAGNTWPDYRRELMLRASQDRLLAPARRVNPKVRIIIKYPNWYEEYQERGYDVMRETAAFDRIWVGTETRDYTDPKWGGNVAYGGYFVMRWLGGIGGEKCGGGWYDTIGTTERSYVEQARQTVLGGARESMLFNYTRLSHQPGQADLAALKKNMPELLAVAREVMRREPVGIAAYKPPNSSPHDERCVFDFVGMMGLPLAPCHEFPTHAPAAFLSLDALADTNLVTELGDFIHTGRTLLLTDGLAKQLAGQVNLQAANVHVLAVNQKPDSLLTLTQPQLDELRAPMLAALGTTFEAPNRVALYLFTRGGWVVENFNDAPVDVTLNGHLLNVEARGWLCHWK